jgi:hypothetical protein
VNAWFSKQFGQVRLRWGFGTLKLGDQLRARFAQVFEFKDGLIWRQRNYNCFDPW